MTTNNYGHKIMCNNWIFSYPSILSIACAPRPTAYSGDICPHWFYKKKHAYQRMIRHIYFFFWKKKEETKTFFFDDKTPEQKKVL